MADGSKGTSGKPLRGAPGSAQIPVAAKGGPRRDWLSRAS